MGRTYKGIPQWEDYKYGTHKYTIAMVQQPNIPTRLMERESDSRGRVTLGSEYADQMVRVLVMSQEHQIDNFRVGFARHHKFDVSKDGQREMFADRVIGIDWNVGPCIHEETYREEGGKSAVADIRTLQRFTDGTLVGAEFREVFPDRMLLGIVEPGSEIEIRSYENKQGDEKYLKTLQLSQVKEVTKSDNSDLFDGDRHPQRGSVRQWDEKELVRSEYRKD